MLAPLAPLAAACGGDAQVTTRAVTLHVPKACDMVVSGGFAQYFELGDFEPAPPATGHLVSQVGETLSEVSDQARALVAEATQSSRTWSGTTPVAPAGSIDVLVLPELESCPLSGSLGARSPASPSAMASIPGNGLLVVGDVSSTATPRSYVADMSTGRVTAVAPDLTTPRSGASVTTFGGGALVAGGANRQGTVLGTAERYTDGGGFDQGHPILLSEPRADHGAVVLAGGETLLVGGVGADGKTVLGSMEIVDPVTNTVREQNVALLAYPRRAPTVLRLASGDVMVAGGTDATGTVVPKIEWFSPDASTMAKIPQDLAAGAARSFVALGGGGALAVVAPPAGADASFQTVWVIDASGAIEAATSLAGVVAPVLFAGTQGAPILWTGSSPSAGGRWLRWQPWQGSFGPFDVLDTTPANITDATASPDPGLAAWLDDGTGGDARLTALRFDVRGDYSTLPGPLLVDSTAEMAPDRLVSDQNLAFDPSTGLALSGDATAFVTDRTYADVSIDVDAPTGEPGFVVLRDQEGVELEVGGVSCPGALPGGKAPSSLHVQRSGATVTWSVRGGASGTCKTGVRSGARLSVGVRGAAASPGRSVVRNLRIVRLGS
jgi:hypothetical protein